MAVLSLIVGSVTAFESGSSALRSSPHGSESIRLATANLHYRNLQKQRVGQDLSQVAADLLVLFECTNDNVEFDPLVSGGTFVLEADGRSQGPEGVCVLASKSLQLEVELQPSPIPGPCAMPFATMRLQTKGGWVSMLAVHAPPPVSRCRGTNHETLAEIASWIRDGRLDRSIGACRKEDPVILLGDLNAFPFSRAVRGIRESGLSDAYAESNWRFGPTWAPKPWMPPLARIDYILVPVQYRVGSGRVTRIAGSDHHMVSVDVYVDERPMG